MEQLFQQKSFLEKKKCKYTQYYHDWVDKAWMYIISINAAGVLINKYCFWENNNETIRGLGFFLLALLVLASVFVICKMITAYFLLTKTKKCSYEITQLEQQIIKELNEKQQN